MATTHSFRKYRHICNPECLGGACASLYDWFPEFTLAVFDAPTQHRSKPTDLINNQTAQAKQSRHSTMHGVIHKPPYKTDPQWCQNPPRLVDRTWEEWDHYFGTQDPLTVFPALDWQTKMRLDIKDLTVNLGASLAEYRQTASMFSDAASTIGSAWRDWRKLKRGKITTCDIASAELTASFGVAPLLGDVFDSVNALQNRFLRPIYKRFVSTASEKGSINESGTFHYIGSWSTSERAIVHVQLQPNDYPFTLGNPLEVAWEVVPFSFVVDWMIPVGDYLSSLDALKDVLGVNGTVTRKEREYVTAEYTLKLNEGWETESLASNLYESHERKLISSIPLPRVPKWDPSTSWKAITHGVSLLRTLNSGCGSRKRS